MKTKKQKQSNPVAKNLRKFNKAKVFDDRKKKSKNGYLKHKKGACAPFSISATNYFLSLTASEAKNADTNTAIDAK